MKELDRINSNLGAVTLTISDEADVKRIVAYITMLDIFQPAKGKKPAQAVVYSTSEYKKNFGSVSILPTEAISPLVNFQAPLINASAKSDPTILKAFFADVDTMVKEYEDSREAQSGPVERKVEESITSLLARVFLVAAGKTGEIPATLELSGYLAKARAEAQNTANELGKDDLGQFRLKKARTPKETDSE